MLYFHILVTVIILYLGQNCLFSFVCPACMLSVWLSVLFACRCVLCWTKRVLVKLWVFYSKFLPNSNHLSEQLTPSISILGMLFINKLFNSIACLLHFINLQLVIPGRTWILLYLGRTVYKRLWACLALYIPAFLCSTHTQQLMTKAGVRFGMLWRLYKFKI